jgi:hypothetical protein
MVCCGGGKPSCVCFDEFICSAHLWFLNSALLFLVARLLLCVVQSLLQHGAISSVGLISLFKVSELICGFL